MVFLISGIECVIDKARANTEIKNRLMAGCITGAALAAPAGPGAACFGCAGFAAFTGAFELLME
jgi:import inner membrane translocase subunit TIM22